MQLQLRGEQVCHCPQWFSFSHKEAVDRLPASCAREDPGTTGAPGAGPMGTTPCNSSVAVSPCKGEQEILGQRRDPDDEGARWG